MHDYANVEGQIDRPRRPPLIFAHIEAAAFEQMQMNSDFPPTRKKQTPLLIEGVKSLTAKKQFSAALGETREHVMLSVARRPTVTTRRMQLLRSLSL